jgi:hypothetical protein
MTSGPPPLVPIHVCAWIVPPPAATVTTPLANVGHVPLGIGKCVGLLPTLEPPEDDPDASPPPLLEPEPELELEPELDPEPELLAPLDDPEPPPLELALPEPPPLLEPPPLDPLLDPPSRPESDPEPELPHEAISPASTKPIDAAAVFMVTPAN